MWRALCLFALVALSSLLIRSARVGLAGDYIDPIARITAQDEALYAHSAIRMATGGGWLTPTFLGRFALYKPPLLLWTAGASARVLGISRIALRLPSALLAALAAGLIFLWAAEAAGWIAGVCAFGLLISNHLWHVMGSLCTTDALLVAFTTAAIYCLFADPWLESRACFWGFAVSVAGAILTKSVAGLLPLPVLGLYWLAAPRKMRPSLSRMLLVACAAAALAAPWFIYQAVVHGRWFFTEHIAVEILGFGAGAPPQTTGENRFLFYAVRLALLDPVLTGLAVVSVPGLLRALRKRSPEALLLCAWLLVSAVAVLGWQYRNASYLLPVIPCLAVLAAVYSPVVEARQGRWMVVFLAGALAVKLAFPGGPWGISYHAGTIQPAAATLSTYCERGRGNELVVVDVADDLYAAVLPLPRVRYAVVRPQASPAPYGMPFEDLGITVSAAQFNGLDAWRPVFRQRLRAWGLDSEAPIGTLIVSRTPAELGELIRRHPDIDFLVPQRYQLHFTGHQAIESGDYLLLLAQQAKPGSRPVWGCGL